MKQSNKKHILARYLLVVGFMLMFSSLIIYDTFKTTVIYAHQWESKADSLWLDTTEIEPERGKILADNGTVLAANMNFFTARVDFGSAGLKDDTLRRYLPALCDSLAAFDPNRSKTAAQWKAEILEARAKRKTSFRLFKKLSHNEFEHLKQFPFFNKRQRESGLYAEKQNARCKPYGMMASRSIGNVSERVDTVYNKATGRRRIVSHGYHGHSGLEMALDSLLYGVPGKAQNIQLTNNAVKWSIVPAISGYDITTTINVQLQDILEEELSSMLKESNARWGTAVLMQVQTGEIKAISNLEWNEEAGDYVEGRNNAVLGYEPGSVMKPISMMVALENGTVKNIDAKWETGAVWNYCGRPIKDPHGGAALSPREIIEMSSNIGMSKITVQAYGNNPDGFRQQLVKMGFFEPYHSGIGGEMEPKFAHLPNNNGGRVALTRMAFGYTTEIPPLHILGMYNAIANDGKYVCPHLVKKLSRAGEPDSIVPVRYIRRQVCSPENAAKLRQCLHDVVWGPHGTARKWVQSDLVEIAGKTGTAYIIGKDGRYGSTKRLAFCGFFPYSHPLYSCVVLMLGADRGAGASSGVVLKNVALKMYARGLLDNKSDYRVTAAGHVPAAPTLYATDSKSRAANLNNGIGLKTAKVLARPGTGASKVVPNVVGLSAREAIGRLERRGMTVRTQGYGYVVEQSLAPGQRYTRGEMVYLKLKN